jgi:hypothetical protein
LPGCGGRGLDAKRKSEMRHKDNITFRLSPAEMEELCRVAKVRKVSADSLAREWMRIGMGQEDLTRRLDEQAGIISELRSELKRHRKDMTTLYGALLYRAGKATVSEAMEWLKKQGMNYEQ